MISAAVPTSTWYLILAAVLFGIGMVGVMVRRNPLIMLMCIELMLNAVNLTFVSLARKLGDDIAGQTTVFFVLVVAAAEVVVGLGIIVAILRRKPNATADDLAELKG
jgi:NADH-quinone oxidoreductase subunit K